MRRRELVIDGLVCRQTGNGYGSFAEKDDHYYTTGE
jgi:hypothetical protein